MPHQSDDSPEPSAQRRDVLQSMAATGFGITAGTTLDSYVDVDVDIDAPDHEPTPYNEATYRALVDLVIPATPGLAEELGDEHGPGGLAVDLPPLVIAFLDKQVTIPTPVQFDQTTPLSDVLAAILDEAASELVAQGSNTDQPDPTRFEGGGPFASLSREDRRRAVSLGEQREEVALLIRVAAAAPMFVYYSERTGCEDYDDPAKRSFEDDVQGWEQTGYEGPAKGHAVLLGYEVQQATDNFDTTGDTPGPELPDAASRNSNKSGLR